jgi:choline kinase
MQAVILAAGVGSRLESMTGGRPKCLAEVGGRPIILHQLDALSDHGIGPVMMVVGHEHTAIREVVGQRAEYLVNERFRETNSLYSLWLAREWIKGDFVLLNSDLLFDPEILNRVLEESGSALAYDSTSSNGREQTKVAIRERRVVDLGKDLPTGAAQGESLGLLKLDAAGAKAMVGIADALIGQGKERAWVIEGTRAACRMTPIHAVNIAGLPWAEVDFPHDLEEARREVWPAIENGRWRRMAYWRRTRWAAAGLAALMLAVGGWEASARVGPGSVDWESVAPIEAPRLDITQSTGSQRWWLVTRDGPVTARLDGGTDVRLELRLLMPPDRPDRARYVVGITVDGVPHDWEAFTASRDSSVLAPGRDVSDRDRVEFMLPPGEHLLGIGLMAGHAESLLVRIRKRE